MSNQGNISNKIDEAFNSVINACEAGSVGEITPAQFNDIVQGLKQSILSLLESEVKRVIKDLPIFKEIVNDQDLNWTSLEEQVLKAEVAWNEYWKKKLEESNQEARVHYERSGMAFVHATVLQLTDDKKLLNKLDKIVHDRLDQLTEASKKE